MFSVSKMTRYGLTISVFSGILLGLGLFTFQYAEGLSYLSKEPEACLNCHIMKPQFDSWQKASHHNVATCVDCHLPHGFITKWLAKTENGFFHSKGFTFEDFHEPIFIREKNQRILNDNCLRCHSDFTLEILTSWIGDNDDSGRCLHCHRSAGHGETVGLGKFEKISLNQ